MKRLILAALPLALMGCTTGGTLNTAASMAATAADAAGMTPPAPAEATTIDEKALTLAAKAVDAAALSASALVHAKIITPGSPAALSLAHALDAARDGVNAAEAARQAGGAHSYREALAKAESAVDQIKAIFANAGA